MIGTTVSHYRILSRIGGGGMGVVYEALDLRLGRAVALKFLAETVNPEDTAALERFLREARAASALNHSNICVIHDFDQHQGRPFMVMELLDGESLSQWIRRGDLDLGRVPDIGIQVCRGLEAAHALGIIHRDIKPSNIILTRQGVAKLLDFGLAKLAEIPVHDRSGSSLPTPGVDDGGMTRSGMVAGTMSYMSPEQALGQPVDARTDLFSLGVTLYEAATGSLPFPGKTIPARMDALLHREPRLPSSLNPGISPGFDAILLRALEKKPEARFQTAAEFREALCGMACGAGTPNPTRLRRLRSVLPVPVRGGVLAGFGLLVFIFVLMLGDWPGWRGNPGRDVAVLPFVNIGESAERSAEALGLTYDITSALSRVQRLRDRLHVVPASEVIGMDCRSPGQARRYFKVDLVVTGTLEWTESNLRLTLSLVDATALRQLDSEVLVEPLSSVQRIREQVLQELDRMLQLALEPRAIAVLAAGSGQSPSAFSHYQRGLGYLERYFEPGNPERAIHAFLRCLEDEPELAGAHAGLARAFLRQYDLDARSSTLDGAERACREALKLDPRSVTGHVACGEAAAGRGDAPTAIREFQEALREDPDQADAWAGLAGVLTSDSPEAQEVRTQLERVAESGGWYGRFQAGVFALVQGRHEDAMSWFRQVLTDVPENYKVHNNLGAANAQLGRLDQAVENFLVSTRIAPNYEAYSNLGTIYSWRKDYSRAVPMYRQALELNGNSHSVWGFLANACRRTPDCGADYRDYYGKAAELAALRISINPRDPWLKADRADYLAETGAREESAGLLAEALAAIDEAPQPAELAFLGSQVYVALERQEDALRWLEEALGRGLAWRRADEAEAFAALRDGAAFKSLADRFGGGDQNP